MTKPLLTLLLLIAASPIFAQFCFLPQGNPNTYGTGDRWFGYVYEDIARTNYRGYIREGVAGNPDFDESFGGSTGSFSTAGCSVSATTFSVRFKLIKTFSTGNYSITVGGDDGYRLSLDGGVTWPIDEYTDRSYGTTNIVVTLSGNVSMVLDYYENSSDNRVSFNLSTTCSGTENTSVYGTGNIWKGYVYDGTAFNAYAGSITQGAAGNADFDQSFGGNNTNFSTSGCLVQTETFSVRYRLRKAFVNKSVTFTVGGDDGYRLSLDGGTNWLIDRWSTQSYVATTATISLNGSYDMVLEFYENTGDNRISFAAVENIILPLRLASFSGINNGETTLLKWSVFTDHEQLFAEPQRSTDGINFTSLSMIGSPVPATDNWNGSYTDASILSGKQYYRLKLTAASGNVFYSSTLIVGTTVSADGLIKVYPTLIARDGSITLVNAKRITHARLLIHDAGGRLVAQSVLGALEKGQASTFSLQAFHLQTGLHLVTITDDNGVTATRKMLVR